MGLKSKCIFLFSQKCKNHAKRADLCKFHKKILDFAEIFLNKILSVFAKMFA
jgi:hypothetical protein